ncbi:MAG: flotillin domain-containing protein [Deltaproteobacteria bacterium]
MALSITKLAEANREAGLKEAEVLREKNAAANSKSTEILMQEAALALLARAPEILRELVKPADKIKEIKVLQMGGSLGGGNGNGQGTGSFPLLGGALGPVAKSILEASAVLPMLKEVMSFAELEKFKDSVVNLGTGPRAPISSNPISSHNVATTAAVPPLMPKTAVPVVAPAPARTRPHTES